MTDSNSAPSVEIGCGGEYSSAHRRILSLLGETICDRNAPDAYPVSIDLWDSSDGSYRGAFLVHYGMFVTVEGTPLAELEQLGYSARLVIKDCRGPLYVKRLNGEDAA